MNERVDYDRVAPTYRDRYRQVDYRDVGRAVSGLTEGASDALELGCGAGHWIEQLAGGSVHVFGIDPSLGMLRAAVTGGYAPRWVKRDLEAVQGEPATLRVVRGGLPQKL